MTAVAAGGWERHADGGYISIPISWRDLDDVRAWCTEHCEDDLMIVLGQRILFQSHEDAALPALRWRAEDD